MGDFGLWVLCGSVDAIAGGVLLFGGEGEKEI